MSNLLLIDEKRKEENRKLKIIEASKLVRKTLIKIDFLFSSPFSYEYKMPYN